MKNVIMKVIYFLNGPMVNLLYPEAATGGALQEKVFLEIRKIHRKTPVSQAWNFIKVETLAQVFSCKFC